VATSNIRNIELNQRIAEARRGDKDALAWVRSSEWFTDLKKKTSVRLAFKFNLIADEIADAISDAVCDHIETIKNPNRTSLAAWCRRTAKNFCLNEDQRRRLADNYFEQVVHAGTIGKRKTASGSSLLPLTASNSPEAIRLEEEASMLTEKLRAALYDEVQQEVKNLPPQDAKILLSWGSGKTLQKLKEETGIPVSTLGNHLKKIQKEIMTNIATKRIVIKKIVKEDPKQWRGVAELIRNSLKQMSSAA